MNDMEEFSEHHAYFKLSYGKHISDYLDSIIKVENIICSKKEE